MSKNHQALYALLIECCRHESDDHKLEYLAGQISDWAGFLESSYAHGVYALVAKSLKSIHAVPDPIKSVLKITNLDIARRNMTMTAELLRIMKLLEDSGISALAIKGPVLSQMIYGDITQRQFADLDILVDENDLYHAGKVLDENGYYFEQPLKYLKNKTLLKIEKDITFSNEQQNIYIEIHWRLFAGKLFAKSNIDLFQENPVMVRVNHQNIATLDDSIYILYLLLHGSKHLWNRLEWIVDIDRLVRTKSAIDWELIRKSAQVMEIEPMIYLGTMMCHRIFETPFPLGMIEAAQHYPNISNASDKLMDRFYQNSIHKVYQAMSNSYYLGIEESHYKKNPFFRLTPLDIYTLDLPHWLSPLYYLILIGRKIPIQIGLFWDRMNTSQTPQENNNG